MLIQLTPDELHFQNFPNAVGAIDTTFIIINKPKSKEDQKRNWSFKHGMCGVKIQALVRPNGLCTLFSVGIPGSVHDFKAFKDSIVMWLERFLSVHMTMQNRTQIVRHFQVLFDIGYTNLNSQGY